MSKSFWPYEMKFFKCKICKCKINAILVILHEWQEIADYSRSLKTQFDDEESIYSMVDGQEFRDFNRYVDIVPFDRNRVLLKKDDYINASWIGFINAFDFWTKFRFLTKKS